MNDRLNLSISLLLLQPLLANTNSCLQHADCPLDEICGFLSESASEQGTRQCRKAAMCGSSEAELVVIEDLATAFIVVVFAVVLASLVLAVLIRRHWIRHGRSGWRHSQEDLDLDRSLTMYCRGRSLPPLYTVDGGESRQAASPVGNSENKDGSSKLIPDEKPPRYISVENDMNSKEDSSSFVVFLSNIQRMLSLDTEGGEDFLRLLESEPGYLLSVLQQHQQDNQECLLNITDTTL